MDNDIINYFASKIKSVIPKNERYYIYDNDIDPPNIDKNIY